MNMRPDSPSQSPFWVARSGAKPIASNPASQPTAAEDRQGSRFPSLATMAANAAKAVLRSGARLFTGQNVRATPATKAAREVICRTRQVGKPCQFFVADEERCAKCGCFTQGQLLGKWALAAEACPDGAWGPENQGVEPPVAGSPQAVTAADGVSNPGAGGKSPTSAALRAPGWHIKPVGLPTGQPGEGGGYA